jgi:RNA polymerase subunit RPABC4/transcription elongation factor Spt4
MSEDSDDRGEIPCSRCGAQISADATWCPHCNCPILTRRRAKLFVVIGSALTIFLTSIAARATLVAHPRTLLITFYLVLAMLCAFATYLGYALLRRRRVALAEHGLTP